MAAAVRGGVDRVQIRDRQLEGSALLAHTDALLAAARTAATRAGRTVETVVNRRLDVALASGADGVHLGFDALPAAEARGLLGDAALVGISAHDPAEVDAAAAEASYAHLAPIYPPLSKTGTRAPLGLAALEACAGARLPVVAQGGIDADNAAAACRAGAAGVAVTGAILSAPDPERAAAALRSALDG